LELESGIAKGGVTALWGADGVGREIRVDLGEIRGDTAWGVRRDRVGDFCFAWDGDLAWDKSIVPRSGDEYKVGTRGD
jgi:hypothetical protein